MPEPSGGQMWTDVGVPTYQLFRAHAMFVPDLTDFALTLKQCNRLMSECGIDFLCGVGLGDSQILYNAVAKKGYMTYDGLCQVFRILGSRQAALRSRVAKEEAAAAAATHKEDPASIMTDLSSRATSHFHASASSTAPQKAGACAGPACTATPGGAGTDGETTARKGNYYAAMATGKAVQPGLGCFSTTPEAASFGASSLLGRTPRTIIGQPLNAQTASTATLKGYSMEGLPPEDTHSSTRAKSPLWGMGALMANQDPPAMLREIIPPVLAPFKNVRAKFKFVKELMSTGQAKIAFGALKELPGEWGLSIEEKQAALVAKRAAKKAAPEGEGAAPPARPPPPSAGKGQSALLHLVPLDGLLYIYLLTGSYALTHDELALARQQFDLAEAAYNVEKMGTEEHYYYLIHMCQGLLSFYEGDYNAALERLERARDLSDLKDRDLKNPVARKNLAFCHNNIGVCALMLGRTSLSASSFQTAVDMLTLLGPGPLALKNQALDVARANLRRSVKYSFASGAVSTARPATAMSSTSQPATVTTASSLAMGSRPMSAAPRLLGASSGGTTGGLVPTRLGATSSNPSLSMSVGGGADERLQRFLKQAITMRTPMAPTAVPAWAVRAVPSEKDAKAKKGVSKDKAGKDGKKGKGEKKKKDKSFKISYAMPVFTPPQYSIANIPAEKKKKKKGVKKGAASADAAAAAVAVDPLALLPPQATAS